VGTRAPIPTGRGAAVELPLEAGTESPVTGSSVEVPEGTVKVTVGVVEAPPALKEEEAGLLQLEVSSIPSRTPSISRHSRSSLPSFRCQGIAGHPRPCACQGAQVEDVLGDRATLGEGTMGSGGRSITRHNCGREAAARGGGGGGRTGVGLPRPSSRVRAGSLGELVHHGPRGDRGMCWC
jgi:hypothetical protein